MRIELERFVEQMEKVLEENDYKGGWQQTSRYFLNKKLIEEFIEYFIIENHPEFDILSLIREIINQYNLNRFENDDKRRIEERKRKELVDIANICMMLADKD